MFSARATVQVAESLTFDRQVTAQSGPEDVVARRIGQVRGVGERVVACLRETVKGVRWIEVAGKDISAVRLVACGAIRPART